MARARGFAERALELDPELAAGHVSLAMVRFFADRDHAGALAGLERAIELDPGYAPGRALYARVLQSVWRLDEAIAQIELAHGLDPLALNWLGADLGGLSPLHPPLLECLRQSRCP